MFLNVNFFWRDEKPHKVFIVYSVKRKSAAFVLLCLCSGLHVWYYYKRLPFWKAIAIEYCCAKLHTGYLAPNHLHCDTDFSTTF